METSVVYTCGDCGTVFKVEIVPEKFHQSKSAGASYCPFCGSESIDEDEAR